jgi:hypothetical protein
MINLGYTPGQHRSATGNTPSARAERSRGRGGRMQRKCSNCNMLRDKSDSTFSGCLPLLADPRPPSASMTFDSGS